MWAAGQFASFVSVWVIEACGLGARLSGGLKQLLGLGEHDRDRRAPVDRGLALEHPVLLANQLQGRDAVSQLDNQSDIGHRFCKPYGFVDVSVRGDWG